MGHVSVQDLVRFLEIRSSRLENEGILVMCMQVTPGCIHSLTYPSFVHFFTHLFIYWLHVAARLESVTAPSPVLLAFFFFFFFFSLFFFFFFIIFFFFFFRLPNVIIHRDRCQQAYEIHLVPPFIYEIHCRPEASESSLHIFTISVTNTTSSCLLIIKTLLGRRPSRSCRLLFLAWALN